MVGTYILGAVDLVEVLVLLSLIMVVVVVVVEEEILAAAAAAVVVIPLVVVLEALPSAPLEEEEVQVADVNKGRRTEENLVVGLQRWELPVPLLPVPLLLLLMLMLSAAGPDPDVSMEDTGAPSRSSQTKVGRRTPAKRWDSLMSHLRTRPKLPRMLVRS